VFCTPITAQFQAPVHLIQGNYPVTETEQGVTIMQINRRLYFVGFRNVHLFDIGFAKVQLCVIYIDSRQFRGEQEIREIRITQLNLFRVEDKTAHLRFEYGFFQYYRWPGERLEARLFVRKLQAESVI